MLFLLHDASAFLWLHSVDTTTQDSDSQVEFVEDASDDDWKHAGPSEDINSVQDDSL